jgi:general secretion pathway protein C
VAGIDTLAKRYFPAVICGLLASVAYLQGRGISSLIGQQLPTIAPPPAHVAAPKLDAADSNKNASVVLQRNAFDSVTGPITGRKPKPASSAPVAAAPSSPGEAPECSSGSVVLIAGADDPSFAFAMIKTSGGKSGGSTMRRVGDDVDGKKVEAIGWDQVVLATGGDRCRLLMHDVKKSGGGSEPASPMAPDFSGPSAGPVPIGPGAADPDIKKVSDTEFVLENNAAGKLGEMQSAFMKTARVVPGKGIRLQRASQTTVLSQMGLKKGDMITTINGHDMTQPDSAMEAYGKLKTSKSVQIVLERDGKPMTIDYSVK